MRALSPSMENMGKRLFEGVEVEVVVEMEKALTFCWIVVVADLKYTMVVEATDWEEEPIYM